MSSRNSFWRFLGVAGAALTAFTLPSGAPTTATATAAQELARAKRLPPEVLPYSPRSAFRRRLPARPRLDPRSGAIVRRLAENVRSNKMFLSASFDVPTVYQVTARDPFYRVSVGGRSVRFRVPNRAVTGSGQDNPIVLLDRRHPNLGAYTELRLYRGYVDHSSRQLHSSGAGLFRYNARGTGTPFLGAGTGSGLSILAGLIRPREVANGEIRHAIRFAYSNIDFIRGAYRAPATKTDQPLGGYTHDARSAMAMGMRLQLSPRVDCNKRTVPGRSTRGRETRFLRMVCRALQRYGMIVVDGTTRGILMVQMENEATAPWRSIIGPKNNGNYGFILRDRTSPGDGLRRTSRSGIPWNQMRVVR